MNLTGRQRRIVSQIDQDVSNIVQQSASATSVEEGVINLMPKHMEGFKYLIDSLGQHGMDRLCQEYDGFYQFAKMMERIAQGCRDGIFDDILAG